MRGISHIMAMALEQASVTREARLPRLIRCTVYAARPKPCDRTA